MGRPTKENEFDWTAIYADWVTGTMTNRALSRKYGCAAATIGQRAKRDGWTTTKGPVAKSDLSEDAEPVTTRRRRDKPAVIKSQSADQLRKRAKDLAQRLLAEVEDITTYESEIAEIIETEESDPIRRRAALKAISAENRIKMTKELTAIIDAVDGKRKINTGKGVEVEDSPKGKKAQKQAEAEKIAAGRFAPRSGPKLVVNR